MDNKVKVLAIVPARGGSKGIPKKNLALLNGKPLIQYTIDAAKNSRLISSLILSSDDDEIIAYCKNQDIKVPFVRPKHLAKDDTPMIDVIRHAVSSLVKIDNYRPDYIILLQPTSPLRKSKHIDESLDRLINSKADSIVSIVDVPHNFNPYSVMRINGKYLKPFLQLRERDNLRQRKPRFYARNGPAILAFTYNCIIDKNSMYGDRTIPYFMNRIESVDIDDDFDLKIAEYIMKTKININSTK
jgi:CMP-N-acetylneuraminic acid synthetase